MALHKSITDPNELHEDKHIAGALVTDAGKIITPSATIAGAGELRNLNYSELVATGFTTAATDAKKVLKPSRTQNGVMVLEQLTCEDIDRTKLALLFVASNSQDTYSITAAVDTTFNTLSDFVPYPFTLNVVENQNVTYNAATKTFTIGNDALAATKYLMSFNCSLTSSANTTRVAVAYVINGSLVPYRFVISGKTAGDFMVGSRSRIKALNPGDTVQLRIACNNTCTLTQQDISLTWSQA